MTHTPGGVCFVVGSTRSGTTVIGDCLGQHPGIGHLYEPYYLWEWHPGIGDDDVLTADMAGPRMIRSIRRDFERFRRCSGAQVILEKSPGTFGMDLRARMFPQARWIHILRDGRDVTLSIHREWERRARLVGQRSPGEFLNLVRRTFSLQPYWYFRLKQIAFELKTSHVLNVLPYRNKSRWRGQVGWGPRFKGWAQVLNQGSLLAFNAHQWLACVEYVEAHRKEIPPERFLEVRYEEFLEGPVPFLRKMVAFMGVEYHPEFERVIPTVLSKNTQNWRRAFTKEQLREISPVLTEKLIQLGYESDPEWASR